MDVLNPRNHWKGMAMKQHPEQTLLIEPDPAGLWQVVARRTTWRGLQGGKMPVLAVCASIERARGHLKWIKRGPEVKTHEHP